MTPLPVETSEQIEATAAIWAIKDRPLSPADEAALREWLSGDSRRRGALLRAQATLSATSRLRALGPVEYWTAERPKLIDTLSRRKLLLGSGVAGGLAAAGVAGFLIGTYRDQTTTAVGEIRRLPMSDGSIAAINTASSIRVSMTDKARNIELVRGEAWFNVARNKQRPFTVSAGRARVQAVGTAFSVNRRDSGTEIQVTEGTVKAWMDGGSEPAVWLNAGDVALLTPTGGISRDHAPDAIDNALAWREGQIALTGQSLVEAANEYNRYNRLKIIIQDPDLGRERLLGRYSADDPEGFSNAIARAFGAEVTRTDNVIYVGAKKN